MFIPYSGKALEIINEQIETIEARIKINQRSLAQLKEHKERGEWRSDS